MHGGAVKSLLVYALLTSSLPSATSLVKKRGNRTKMKVKSMRYVLFRESDHPFRELPKSDHFETE
jgi:hypothetical protein